MALIEENLYKELLANTTGKCQKIFKACKLANPEEPGCTSWVCQNTKLSLKHFQHWQS